MNGKVLAFLVGTVTGSVLTYFMLKEKFEKNLNEEIDSVKKSFSSKYERKITKEDIEKTGANVSSIDDYKKRIDDLGYSSTSSTEPDISETIQPEVDEHRNYREHPYVISPDQFGEFADYSSITLTYFKDGALCDDLTQEQIVDIKNTIGDGLNHFGEYEEDVVYVRNERLKTDYEVLRDLRRYADILTDKPYIDKINKMNYSNFKEE